MLGPKECLGPKKIVLNKILVKFRHNENLVSNFLWGFEDHFGSKFFLNRNKWVKKKLHCAFQM